MAELQIPPSINDSRSQALLALVDRLGQIDLGPLLVYRIDSVPASALPFLAWQFDILSPLWQAVAPVILSVDAITDVDELIDIDTLTEAATIQLAEQNAAIASQRALLKIAIQLHRFRGTPWSIKSALATLGWENVTLLEGQNSWGGTSYPSNQGWAVFRVTVQLAQDQVIDSDSIDTAVAAIMLYKPVRSWLDGLFFALPPILDSAPSPADLLTITGIAEYQLDSARAPSDNALSIAVTLPPTLDTYGPAAPLYDAHYLHSGITYGSNEPAVADSALIVNGNAVLQGG
jgi:P2-related tail formation protein